MATNKNDSMLTVDKDIKDLYKQTAQKEGMTIKYLARILIQNYTKRKT